MIARATISLPGCGARLGPSVPGGNPGIERQRVPAGGRRRDNQVSVLRITAKSRAGSGGEPVPSAAPGPSAWRSPGPDWSTWRTGARAEAGQSGFRLHSDGSLIPVLVGSHAHNGANLGTVSAYNDFFGQLKPIGSSPFGDGQTAPCWAEISHDGRYLSTINTGSANISSYLINPDGSLTLFGSAPIAGGGGDTRRPDG